MSQIKTRIGIIGAGWWAIANHLPILMASKNVELGGVCRLGRAELDELVSRFGFAFGSEDFNDIINQPDLDGVIVASPHHLHTPHAIGALEKGLHVLVEKPAAVDIPQALALHDAARKSGKTVIVPHGWNWRDYSTIGHDWIAEGEIGEIRHISLQMASPAEDLFTGRGFTGAATALFKPAASTWADPASAGGYGWGQLPHLLGLLFLTLPDLVPDRVFAQQRAGHTGSDLYDAAVLRFKGGILGALSGAATVPPQAPFQVDIRIFGTNGMVLIDLERERLELWRNDNRRAAHAFASGEGAYVCQGPVETFIDTCRGKNPVNLADTEMVLKCTRIVDGIYHSSSTGGVVDVTGATVTDGRF